MRSRFVPSIPEATSLDSEPGKSNGRLRLLLDIERVLSTDEVSVLSAMPALSQPA